MEINGACRSLGHVVHLGMSSTGACCPTGHIVHRGIVSLGIMPPGAYYPPGQIVYGTCCHPGHIVQGGILSKGIVSPGHTVSKACRQGACLSTLSVKFENYSVFYGRCPEGIGRHKVKMSFLLYVFLYVCHVTFSRPLIGQKYHRH